MIIGEKYIFIHFPKTGGTTISSILEKFSGKILYNGGDKNNIVQNIPTEYKDKFIFGFVRNPWDFYFSLFHFLKNDLPDYSYLRFCSNNNKNDFIITMKKFLDPRKYMTKEEYYNYVKYIMVFHNDNFFDNNFKISLENFLFMEKNNIGFYSLLYHLIFYENLTIKRENVNIYKYENLKDVFREISYSKLGVNFEEIEKEFDTFLNVNDKKPKLHYSNYYDEELIDLIRKKDSIIIDNYGYKFERF